MASEEPTERLTSHPPCHDRQWWPPSGGSVSVHESGALIALVLTPHHPPLPLPPLCLPLATHLMQDRAICKFIVCVHVCLCAHVYVCAH